MASVPCVTFYNHSCISVSSPTTTILCDPWFTGSAFDNGWRLLAENSHDLGALEYDWLWLSHEHPDHFSIPTLKQIKKRAHVIYQQTADQKVKTYLSRQHDVSEIGDFETKRFGDIDCTLFMSDGYDSAMLFKLPDGSKVLNLNDCRIELNDLAKRIGEVSGDVDLLAMQFSYANWAGNRGDRAIPKYQHDQVVKRLESAIENVRAKAVLLFASYVYFSHEDNFFWNEHFWLGRVLERLGAKAKLIVPKPDDVVPLENLDSADFSARNAAAVEYWTKLHDTREPVDKMRAGETVETLRAHFRAFCETLWRDNDLEHARKTSRGPLELVVRLRDIGTTVSLELFSGRFDEVPEAQHDIEISSETLAFLFKSKFGRGTLTINGRIELNYPTAHKFFAFFFVYYANNVGRYLKPGGLQWKSLRSIENTAVLDSIFATVPAARAACRAYLDGFIAES